MNDLYFQLVIYACLAAGTTKYRAGEVTMHTQTAIYFAQLMTQVTSSLFHTLFNKLVIIFYQHKFEKDCGWKIEKTARKIETYNTSTILEKTLHQWTIHRHTRQLESYKLMLILPKYTTRYYDYVNVMHFRPK